MDKKPVMIRKTAKTIQGVPQKYRWGAILFGGVWLWYEEQPPTPKKS